MKKNIRFALLGMAYIAATTLVNAQFTYSTDFSSGGYTQNAALLAAPNPSYNDGWYVTPTSAADPNSVYAAYIQSGQLRVGGDVLKSVPTVPAGSPTYAQKDIALNSNSVSFRTTFYIQPSTLGSSDTFGWMLFNANKDLLMSIDLNYTSGTSYTLGATSYADNTPTDSSGNPLSQALKSTNGSALSPLSTSSQYTLAFNIYNIGQANQSVSAFSYNAGTNNPPLLLGNTSIDGTDFSSIGDTNIASFASYWYTTNTATYGNNYLAMSNLSVSSVPEPKTWILLGLSSLVLVVVLRRRTSP